MVDRRTRVVRFAVACGLLGSFLAFVPDPVQAERKPVDYEDSVNDFGGIGLLQTRTARFAPDGQIDVGLIQIEPYRRYYVTLQALPWLEGTFRYTEIQNRSFSLGGLASDQSFQDRGADLKFKLWDESRYIPQIAIGFQDGLGTGLFSGEYIVASKRYYDLDFSAGIGWGYFSSGSTVKNPLASVSPTFERRTNSDRFGGSLRFDYFAGETIGLFGGVSWRTPVDGLSVKLEYNTQDYQSEPLANNFQNDSPISLGLVYRPFEWLEVSGAFERGNTAMFRAAIRGNLHDAGLPKFDEPPPKLKVRQRKSAETDNHLASRRFDPLQRNSTTVMESGAPVPVKPQSATDRGRRPALSAHQQVADRLFDQLLDAGLDMTSVEFGIDETRVHLGRGTDTEYNPDLVAAAAMITQTLSIETGRIRFVYDDASGRPDTIVSNDEIERTLIVDYLYDSLEDQRYVVERLDMNDREVTLYASGGPADDDQGEMRAANIILNALPTSADRVVFVHMDEGRELRRVALRREDIRRVARIDQMFDGLEARGFVVESLELAYERTTVRLTSESMASPEDYEEAARFVELTSPEPTQDVVVVGMQSGIEATRVSLKRPSAASGQDHDRKGELVPDLTDNEKRDIALNVFKELEKHGVAVDAFHLSRFKVTAFVTPTQFRQYARNVGRVARALANNVPDSVEELEIVTLNSGLETGRIRVLRHDLENAVSGRGSVEEIWAGAKIEPPGGATPDSVGYYDSDVVWNDLRYPTLSWHIRPAIRTHVGGPDALFLYQIYIATTAQVELAPGLGVTAVVGKNVTSTLDEITLRSDSQLPHVRSDIREYLQEGEDGNIQRLQADYVFRAGSSLFGRVSAGLFEEMFGGVGGELLYRPLGSRLAVGIDINRVRQREYDQRFDFRDYEVTTGHLNLYYKLPFLGILAETHTGQFLAGDRGTQFVLSRRFESGIQFGGWATMTDVPAEVFGEGSFDKGVYISIPLEVLLASSSRRVGTFSFRPLTRDGGQMLGMAKRLYGLVDHGNLDAIAQDWNRFLD